MKNQLDAARNAMRASFHSREDAENQLQELINKEAAERKRFETEISSLKQKADETTENITNAEKAIVVEGTGPLTTDCRSLTVGSGEFPVIPVIR